MLTGVWSAICSSIALPCQKQPSVFSGLFKTQVSTPAWSSAPSALKKPSAACIKMSQLSPVNSAPHRREDKLQRCRAVESATLALSGWLLTGNHMTGCRDINTINDSTRRHDTHTHALRTEHCRLSCYEALWSMHQTGGFVCNRTSQAGFALESASSFWNWRLRCMLWWRNALSFDSAHHKVCGGFRSAPFTTKSDQAIISCMGVFHMTVQMYNDDWNTLSARKYLYSKPSVWINVFDKWTRNANICLTDFFFFLNYHVLSIAHLHLPISIFFFFFCSYCIKIMSKPDWKRQLRVTFLGGGLSGSEHHTCFLSKSLCPSVVSIDANCLELCKL